MKIDFNDARPAEAIDNAALSQFKLRSDGVLSDREIQYCKTHAIALAYDPMQLGWVMAESVDDILETGRMARQVIADISFRDWHRDDAPRYAELLSDAALWTYMPEGYPGALSTQDAKALIELSQSSTHHWVQAVEHDGAVGGQVRIIPNGSEGEISYWLDADVRGKGLGHTMVRRFTRNCFAAYPELTCLFARVHADNAASARVVKGCGFERDPMSSDATWHIYRITRS